LQEPPVPNKRKYYRDQDKRKKPLNPNRERSIPNDQLAWLTNRVPCNHGKNFVTKICSARKANCWIHRFENEFAFQLFVICKTAFKTIITEYAPIHGQRCVERNMLVTANATDNVLHELKKLF
jgi:hypothetical protein